ncbi:MAG: DUF4838 domain-containing protein [Lentisphaeria bacterium]|nr:DUF4838 domain-containing protein [Lentisphaeria bacterium]
MQTQRTSIPIVATIAAMLLVASASAAPLELVKEGHARATIVIDSARYPRTEDLTNQWQTLERTIRNMADTVADYVRQSTGADLPIIDRKTEALPKEGVLLHIGRSEYVDRLMGDELAGMDQTGYIIRATGGRNLVVAGQTPEGTEFGTYEFLEQFVGIRWLMPTKVGEHVPKQVNLGVPGNTNIIDEPAFMQVPGIAFMPTHKAWARKMRFWTRLRFHHSLVKLFAPQMYKETHPEFFPLKHPDDPKRYVPANDKDYHWQPCFTAPGIVDEAARRIIGAFDRAPSYKSYSFGVNDSNDYCQCETCRKEYIKGEKFLGYASYSDCYFKFCNAVVDKVLAVHPDAWFGLIAYSHVGAPPVKVEVHPRIVPFMTYDTMQLIDPDRRERHEKLLQAWQRKCTFIGRYDYTYGDHHVPPRIYIHHWAKYVRWARDHNVRAWYAETYPFFGEAPKYYVMAKIWWNPDRDVDTILDEWYRLSFGKAAGPMKAYFAHWEDYWTRRVRDTGLFLALKNSQYCMGNPGFLEALTEEDIQIGDAFIAQAQTLADTPETKARVEVMALSWQYYRTVMGDFFARGKGASQLSAEQALAILNMDRDTLDNGVQKMRKKMEAHPILVFSWNRSYPYDSSLRQPILDAGQTLLARPSERLRQKFLELAQSDRAKLAAQAGTFLKISESDATNLVPNPGFEAENSLDGWWAGTHFGTGSVKITKHKPHQGENAVVVQSTWDGYGGVFRTDVPIEPGKAYIFVLRAREKGKRATATVCQMLTQFFDARGKVLSQSTTRYKFWPRKQWDAYLLETPVAPANAATLNARVDAMAQPKTGHQVYFDDLQVHAVEK